MKLLKTLLLIMFIAIQFCSAQEATDEYIIKADSIQKLLSKHKTDDQIKVVLLNEFARFSNHSLDFKKGLIATKQARQLSKKLNYTNGEVEYYRTMEDLFRNGVLSFYYRKRADWLSSEMQKVEGVLNQNSKMLTWPINLDHKKNLARLSNALLYFEQTKDREMLANIETLIAWSNFEIDKPEVGKKYLQKSLSLFKELNEAYPVILLSTYQMSNFKIDGKIEEAHNMEIDIVKMISRIKDKKLLALLSLPMADNYSNSGQFTLAIEYYLKSANFLEENIRIEDKDLLGEIYYGIAGSYESIKNQSKALEFFTKREKLFKEMNDTIKIYDAYGTMVFPLIQLKRYKEARKYMELALQEPNKELANYKLARYNDANGQIEMMQGNYEVAIPFFKKAIDLFKKGYIEITPFIYCYLSECYQKTNNLNKAIENGILAYNLTKMYPSKRIELKSSLLLSRIYEQMGRKDNAFKYLKIYQELKDVSDDLDASNRLANYEIQSILEKSKLEIEKIDKQRLEKESQNKNQRWWIFTIASALFSTMVLLFILFRNNKNIEKANNLLSKQKEEIKIQKNKVEETLTELKSAQAQLIQSEKMASLGELTAGIAHEIQNPLNFVNNFSEVSEELIEEVLGERLKVKGERDEKLEEEILSDIKDNLAKIHHHGHRASSIVKGMLEHSRSSSGKKELTDINALADEYLRLAYHGFRAKEKGFNADFETHFDVNLPKIEVIPQDIGRVLLNLINNAFQACSERSSGASTEPVEVQLSNNDNVTSRASVTKDYKPLVTVSTLLTAQGSLLITIKDNGSGIPDEIKDKIFQPFFTTKDTGKGTGLGLSLAYDIVKAHGGEIEVESKENEGASFKIKLPIS